MKYPPNRTRGLLKMKPLQTGERSHTYRVRAADAVHGWWGSLTAEERGELLARVMAAEAPAEAGEGQGAPSMPEAPSWPSGVPARPLTPHGRELLAQLEEGAVLVKDGHRYRLVVDGVTVRNMTYQTPATLILRGLIVETEPDVWRALK
ncbi:hypothetical protein [Deinococcus aluminii]|uniref:Uncharacterized protein n=1 Tax=Deinococcus aluminii TaxID=1656885 RepID=A0ABP9XIL4_9DEIO